jgi:hypothetical protein
MSRNRPVVFILCLTVMVGLLGAATPVRAGDETVIHSFNENSNDTVPYAPMGGVIFDAAGNLYGAALGGAYGGTVYELSLGANGRWTPKPVFRFTRTTPGLSLCLA